MDISYLNNQQQLAVSSTEGKVRVIAGAGTGKTLVLVSRYAYLVNVLGIDPHNILCLTFTNKAAKEMRIRLANKFCLNTTDSYIGTLHGFGLNFLRENYNKVGLSKEFGVMDREDCISLAKDILNEKQKAKKMVYEISDWKYSIKDEYLSSMNAVRIQGATKDYPEPKCMFVRRQQDLNMVDYDDLILYTYSLLMTDKTACQKWIKRYDYVMVDEAQDCSSVEWEIINKLSESSGNLFVVGDPDQCIYQWRGASPESLVNFKPDVDIILNENYRSTQCILDVANDVISHNKMRVPKILFSQIHRGVKPEFYYLQDGNCEGGKIASLIKEKNKNTPYSEMAVLYRNSSVSQHIERALISEKIPYTIWGGVRFYERKEIKDILAYLRLIAFKDDLSFKRIVNVPTRHIGPVSFDKILIAAKGRNVPLFDGMSYAELRSDTMKTLIKFREDINVLVDFSKRKSIEELIELIVDKFQLHDWYENDEVRIENIEALKQSSKLYEEEMKEQNRPIDLKGFLQDISLYTNIDQEYKKDSVRLMTIRQSKGLEFSCVFLCGLTDGILPSKRTVEESGIFGLEEERRLMYVALTRAKDFLCLTDAKGFNYYGEKESSMFIDEIDKKHIRAYRESSKYSIAKKNKYKSNSEHLVNPLKLSETATNTTKTFNIFGPFEHNEIVRHYKYGVCIFDKYVDNTECYIIQNNTTLKVKTIQLFKVNKDLFNFSEGQWVKCKGFGICRFVKDIDMLNCMIRLEGNEYSVVKYDLQKVTVDDANWSKRFHIGDIFKYNNYYAEVYDCDFAEIKYRIDNNTEHNGILSNGSQGIRLIIHPVIGRVYWAKDNNKLIAFVYRNTIINSNGISLVGENEVGNKVNIDLEKFCRLRFTIFKQDISILKNIYSKISDEDFRINTDIHTNIINNPLHRLDTILAGDIIKYKNKYYRFLHKDNNTLLCRKVTSNKEIIISEIENIHVVARPYDAMFYKDGTKYFYFDGFKMLGSRLCLFGISIDKRKCTPSYIDIVQVYKNRLEPCAEKDFWISCKDKIGYINYRYKYNLK